MAEHKFKVGDLVKVNKTSDVVYKVSWIGNGFECQIQEKRNDGDGWYSAQTFDLGCLIPA